MPEHTPLSSLSSVLQLVGDPHHDSSFALRATILGFLQVGDVESAAKSMQRMEESGYGLPMDLVKPIIYAVVRRSCEIESGQKGLPEMVMSETATSNVAMYNRMINTHALAGDVGSAEQCFLRMFSSGVTPNMSAFGLICKAYAFHGQTSAVENVMKSIEDAGGKLNTFLYATLIISCGNSKPADPDRAERAVLELVDRGLQPRSVKSTLARVMNPGRVKLLFQRLMQDGRLTNLRD